MKNADPFAAARARAAPAIERRPKEIRQHGEVRIDDYAWLRAENWREVLRDPSALPADIRAALEAENAYYEAVVADLAPLRKALFEEMRARIKEDDESVPLPDGPWRYWTAYRKGGEYPVFKRAPREGGPEQILFDGDRERGDGAFFNIGRVAHSPDHRLLAYAVDRVGSENYVIRVRRIETSEDLPDRVERADGSSGAVWAADGSGFFYVERDDHQRPKRVRFHRLGADPAADRVVYEEPDDGFFLHVSKSLSGAFIFIESGDHTTSEARFLPADASEEAPRLIAAREAGVEYDVEHQGERFVIRTNADGAVDFKLATAPVAAPGRENWRDLVPHRPGTLIVKAAVFRDYIVRLERRDALPHLVVSSADGAEYEIRFKEAAYSLGLHQGYEYDTQTLRFAYESPATPTETYDFDMKTRRRRLLKVQEVPCGHDRSRYVVERIHARAPDGEAVPITILRLKKQKRDGSAPALLYGYGSYGITIPADFFSSVLPLVDRGMIYAVAHVRGGTACGRRWYLDGKLDRKMNTFTDFIACAEALMKRKYAARGKVVIYGGSAGGLLVGACVNMRPDLFGGVIAAVPFVDVLNTVSDPSLPLTPPEWNEWGNPVESAEQYGWIRAYSPYENVRETDYPPIMATGGLADFRVTYWEPAKWIAKLRRVARGGPFVLRMNMEAGHGGAAARFERLEERAHLYAFALKCVGLDAKSRR
ncbi:S9 family peptidase [Amphiplicatus metriothermophilus]|uniref:Oligopeptidase B Serine peptidase. MEROPS family S09A n=1 Tax=Amphiplicatus metriothermophilus TaxID=1519374 RepID=A0A239PQ67_9PROT|nr:S9 family peptidase [Amphiplicatus metriothermophilus]MBB5518650.1 oligopeptidase B [Amphiplicatus metriothermophilus]SNT72193.1 oligopeptidase B Serine peptidase. MEROPS family S09A [Amphiplicatus metriothermophilus]